MNEQQKLYELNYWMAAPAEKNTARQVKLAQLWSEMSQPKLSNGMKILEVGPGPYGGLLAMLYTPEQVKIMTTALDPLWKEYADAGFTFDWAVRLNCHMITSYRHLLSVKAFDLVICANVLDHGKADLSELKLIHDAMAPGGELHLHLNLRTQEQCNEGHPVPISIHRLGIALGNAGFKPVDYQVYDRDPVEDSDYKTVVGVWEKAK